MPVRAFAIRAFIAVGIGSSTCGLSAQGVNGAAQAKAVAEHLETLVRIEEAKSKIAAAKAAQSVAEREAAIANAKSEVELQKAKADLYKSLVPDLSKYRPEKPDASQLKGTAARVAARHGDEVGQVAASQILDRLDRYWVVANARCARLSLMLGSPQTNGAVGMISAWRSTTRALDLTLKDLDERRRFAADIAAGLRDQRPEPRAFVASALPAALAVGELVVSVLSAFRPQYAFGSLEAKTVFSQALAIRVEEAVRGRVIVVDPPSILVLDYSKSEVHLKDQALAASVGAARREAADLLKRADERGISEHVAPRLRALAEGLVAAADSAATLRAALVKQSESGMSPFDVALGGESLGKLISDDCTLLLEVSADSSDIDSFASEGLIRSLRVWYSGTSSAHWRLHSIRGTLVATGFATNRPDERPLEVDLAGSGRPPSYAAPGGAIVIP